MHFIFLARLLAVSNHSQDIKIDRKQIFESRDKRVKRFYGVTFFRTLVTNRYPTII
jgi:hypothetical protein